MKYFWAFTDGAIIAELIRNLEVGLYYHDPNRLIVLLVVPFYAMFVLPMRLS